MTLLNKILTELEKKGNMTTKECNEYYSLIFGFKTTSTIKAIRNGKHPNEKLALKLERNFGVSIEELMSEVK